MDNKHTGQLKGPFLANKELFSLPEGYYINHIGIQAETPKIVIIDDNEYEMGKTEIYELFNTKIYSVKFKEDMDNNTIIDYVIKKDTH